MRTASTISVNFHVPTIADPDREMNQQLNDYFTLEQAGAEIPFAVPESEADQRARRLLEETTRMLNRFETGLLWKMDIVALERKLARDPVLKARIHEQLDEYVAKGYCHRATPEELAAADAFGIFLWASLFWNKELLALVVWSGMTFTVLHQYPDT